MARGFLPSPARGCKTNEPHPRPHPWPGVFYLHLPAGVKKNEPHPWPAPAPHTPTLPYRTSTLQYEPRTSTWYMHAGLRCLHFFFTPGRRWVEKPLPHSFAACISIKNSVCSECVNTSTQNRSLHVEPGSQGTYLRKRESVQYG